MLLVLKQNRKGLKCKRKKKSRGLSAKASSSSVAARARRRCRPPVRSPPGPPSPAPLLSSAKRIRRAPPRSSALLSSSRSLALLSLPSELRTLAVPSPTHRHRSVPPRARPSSAEASPCPPLPPHPGNRRGKSRLELGVCIFCRSGRHLARKNASGTVHHSPPFLHPRVPLLLQIGRAHV